MCSSTPAGSQLNFFGRVVYVLKSNPDGYTLANPTKAINATYYENLPGVRFRGWADCYR
jgi:hypothetical protein